MENRQSWSGKTDKEENRWMNGKRRKGKQEWTRRGKWKSNEWEKCAVENGKQVSSIRFYYLQVRAKSMKRKTFAKCQSLAMVVVLVSNGCCPRQWWLSSSVAVVVLVRAPITPPQPSPPTTSTTSSPTCPEWRRHPHLVGSCPRFGGSCHHCPRLDGSCCPCRRSSSWQQVLSSSHHRPP